MSDFSDGYWTSSDGLRLYYRDYPGSTEHLPVVCLHGLTRNTRDFSGLAQRLAGKRRVICPDMRGRGESEYAKAAESYNVIQYVDDVNLLLKDLGIERFVAVGTSMGGLMIMLMAMKSPERLAGVVLNDIGTVLEKPGLDRIKEYVGQGRNFPTWVHAARSVAETQGVAHPNFELANWVEMAKRTMTLTSNGRIVLDYDIKIAEPFLAIDFDKQPDMMSAIDALADTPALILRGAVSDLLSAETCETMMARLHNAEAVTVPDVGHAPLLTEGEAVVAIDRLLAKVA